MIKLAYGIRLGAAAELYSTFSVPDVVMLKTVPRTTCRPLLSAVSVPFTSIKLAYGFAPSEPLPKLCSTRLRAGRLTLKTVPHVSYCALYAPPAAVVPYSVPFTSIKLAVG